MTLFLGVTAGTRVLMCTPVKHRSRSAHEGYWVTSGGISLALPPRHSFEVAQPQLNGRDLAVQTAQQAAPQPPQPGLEDLM